MSRTSVLGGESGHRGFFGAGQSPTRIKLLFASLVLSLILMLVNPMFIFLGIIFTAVSFVTTMTTSNGTVLDRMASHRRVREHRRNGTGAFQPFDEAAWEQTFADSQDKTLRKRARRTAASLRQMPDGADGLGWLAMELHRPGIAWNQPIGETEYLSVAFNVGGQIRGIESQASLEDAQEKFGRFLASLGLATSLANKVQSLTRVLPPDTARHEAWIVDHLDPHAPVELMRSYDDLIKVAARDSMIMRHFIVVAWPINDAFKAEAAKLGPGRDGWRELMNAEINSVVRRLYTARMGDPRRGDVWALTAKQAAGVMRHMQNPSFPIDQASDVDPTNFGQPAPTYDRSAHVVDGIDPATGDRVQWWHRTAVITAEHLSTGERTALWTLPMLTGMATPIIRTISFVQQIIPASEAARAARKDLVSDMSDQTSKSSEGKVADADGSVRLSAAARRIKDLTPGQNHQGVEWVGYLTLSAPTREDLAKASRLVREAAENGMGISALKWLDTYQGAASGCTWPLARGIKPSGRQFSDQLTDRITGHGSKESL